MSSTDEETRPLALSSERNKGYNSGELSQPIGRYKAWDSDSETRFGPADQDNLNEGPGLVKSGTYSVYLSWSNITVKVQIPGKRSLCGESTPGTERTILQNVDGVAAPGSLIAIIGASGSGKSTLLNVLTSRNIRDYTITGDIRLNGVQIGPNIKNVSAYVQQDDLFIHTLTVRETLQFRALLRMDQRFSRKERYERVQDVIGELGLSICADSRIGGASGSFKGISGGERKRLAFACEALTNPPIFFCDEPTSNLDSFMAQNVVQTMQKMAARGRTILSTIHQPSSEVFAMFDQIVILSEGRLAFMGESSKGLEFFESLEYPCPDNFNPADHYILTMAIVPGEEVECRKKTNAICDAFTQTETAKQLKHQEQALQSREGDVENLTDITMITNVSQSRYSSPLRTKLSQLFWRGFVSQIRDPMLVISRITQVVLIALIIGLIYLQLDINQKGVINVNGALFIMLNNVLFANILPVLTSFPEEMGIVMREYGSGMYGLVSYYITKVLSELPLFALSTLVYTAITYWMIGLHDTFEAFVTACLILSLLSITTAGLGYAISIVSGSTPIALSVTSPIMTLFLLFGGLYLNDDSVPVYFVWLKKLSFIKYSFEVLMTNQWKHIDHIDCEFDPFGYGNRTGPMCAFKSGLDVLRYQNMEKDNNGKDFAILGALAAAFYVIALVALVIRGRRSKE